MNQKKRTIGFLAKETGISIESVRFYERKKLIEQPDKPFDGYRHYPDETVNRILFIKSAQGLGFTLAEIASLLAVNDSPCGKVKDLATHKLSSVQDKIANLARLEKALIELLHQCDINDNSENCPIIDSLTIPLPE